MRAIPFTFRTALGAGLLLLQLGAIVYARFVPSRYFCWAPYDAQNEYEIEATVAARVLSPEEIRLRYRKSPQGVDNRSIQHVKDIIQGVEQNAVGEKAQVTLRYRVNGGEEQVWRWPQP